MNANTTAPERITVDTNTTGETCDQCMNQAAHRVLVDGFPLYLVCAADVPRAQAFARDALTSRVEPTATGSVSGCEAGEVGLISFLDGDLPAGDTTRTTTCPVCGCEADEADLISVRGSDPMCWECRRETE
jgi:hypothetical protein